MRAHRLVRGIGAGINELGMMPRFLDSVGLDFFLVALRYTLIEQEVLGAEFPYCEPAGVGVVVGSVYNSGITATVRIPGAKYNYSDATEEAIAKVDRIQAICKAHGALLAAAALNFRSRIRSWPRSFPALSLPSRFGRTFWSDLKREGLLSENAPTPA